MSDGRNVAEAGLGWEVVEDATLKDETEADIFEPNGALFSLRCNRGESGGILSPNKLVGRNLFSGVESPF